MAPAPLASTRHALTHSLLALPTPLACTQAGPALGLVIATQACIVLYAAGYLLLIRRSFQILNNLPYKQFRIANFMVRLQVGWRGRAGRGVKAGRRGRAGWMGELRRCGGAGGWVRMLLCTLCLLRDHSPACQLEQCALCALLLPRSGWGGKASAARRAAPRRPAGPAARACFPVLRAQLGHLLLRAHQHLLLLHPVLAGVPQLAGAAGLLGQGAVRLGGLGQGAVRCGAARCGAWVAAHAWRRVRSRCCGAWRATAEWHAAIAGALAGLWARPLGMRPASACRAPMRLPAPRWPDCLIPPRPTLLQFVQSCIAAANAFIFMPKRPHSTGILQVRMGTTKSLRCVVGRRRARI